MKKIISITTLICLLFTGFISYFQVNEIKNRNEQAHVQEQEEAAAEITPVDVPQVDMAALYASRGPEEIVGTVNGRDVTWSEYFYFYSGFVEEIENLFLYFGAYGYALSWDDEYEEGVKFAAVPEQNASQAIRQYEAMEIFAQEKSVTLSEEEEEALKAQVLSDAEKYCGEGATEEQLEEYLAPAYLPLPLYKQMLHTNAVYTALLERLYGGASEDGDNEAALSAALQERFEGVTFEPNESFVMPSIHDYLIEK